MELPVLVERQRLLRLAFQRAEVRGAITTMAADQLLQTVVAAEPLEEAQTFQVQEARAALEALRRMVVQAQVEPALEPVVVLEVVAEGTALWPLHRQA